MGSRLRLLLVVVSVIAVVVALLVVALPRLLVNHGIAVKTGNALVYESPVTLSMPIYVIGPQILVQRLVSMGINQSLIKSVPISELPSLPNGSVVVVDWSLIKPCIVVGDPLGKITINLTSPVIRDLASAIAKSDIVGVYANGSDEGVVEFVLAYSWAIATNHRLIFEGRPSSDYLLIYPIIPVNTHEPVVIVVRWVKPWGLVIGPVYLSQLPMVITNMMKLTTTATTASSNADPVQGEDPCFEGYSYYYSSSPPSSVIVTSSTTFIWAAPMLYSGSYQYGIPGYSDGNGTYYWDTCLLASNYVFGIAPPSIPINVIGYEEYFESSTMYDNNGFEGYQVGAIDYYTGYQMYSTGITNALVGDAGPVGLSPNSWNPPPMRSTFSYEIFPGFNITLPPGTSESIRTLQNPAVDTSLPNVPLIVVSNLTWTYDINVGGSDVGFPNAFEDISPASIYLQSLSTTSTAAFLMDFENYAATSTVLCNYFTDQTIWVNAEWYIVVVPQSSSTVSLTQSSLNLYLNSATTPPGSYVTGVSSSIVYTPCITSP